MADVVRRRGAVSFAVSLAALAVAGPVAAQNAVGEAGLYVSVPNPLNDAGFAAVRGRVEAARKEPDRRPATIVFDFNPGDKDAAGAGSEASYNLADLIVKLTDTKTVAYVHQKVTGHAVLPALACQQLVCGPQGAVGEVVAPGEPALAGFRASGYKELLERSRPAVFAVAQKMYDPRTQLRKGQKNGADWFFDLRDRAAFEKAGGKVTNPAPLSGVPDERVGLFSAGQLRDLGLSRGTFAARQDVLDAYGLTAAALKADLGGDRPAVAVRYVLRGPVDGGVREAVGRVVADAVRKKATVLVLQLECGGGDLQAARDLAGDLQKVQSTADGDGLRVVAFVPDKAPDTGAVVALGCSEIVMSRRTDAATAGGDPAPEAEFGDFEAVLRKGAGPAVNVDLWVASLRDLAEAQGYPPVLVDGMLRRDVEIVRVHKKTDRGVRRLMTGDEYRQDQDKGAAAEWQSEGQLKPKGQLLKLSTTQAVQLGLARAVNTRDVAEVYALYGLDPAKVADAAPSVLDRFAEFLKLPVVTVLLVVIGFTGLILELKVPGTTVPGIVAALCFILVFWAHTQFSGQVAVLAGLLFLLGLVLILLEVFVLPGIGAAGITGILLMLAALGLVTFNEIPTTAAEWLRFGGKVAQYMVGMVASVGLAFLIARFLPNIPYANRLMLVPPGDKDGAADEVVLPGAALAARLLGAVGTAVTVLRPAGTVRFGDEFVDVVTEGGFIPAGARVQVVEVEGVRIVVKEV